MLNNKKYRKIRSLIERVGSNMTPRQAALNEKKWLFEYNMAKDEYYTKFSDFINMLENIGDTKMVTICYASDAKLKKTIPIRNPITHRMNYYPDWRVFNKNGEDEVAGIIKLTTYNLQFRKRDAITGLNNASRERIGNIRERYGLPRQFTIKTRFAKADKKGGNVENYVGKNEELNGRKYIQFNVANSWSESHYYAFNKNGKKIREISENEIEPYLEKLAGDTYGVHVGEKMAISALKELNRDSNTIKDYLDEIFKENQTFKFKRFEARCVLFMAANVDKSKKLYINQNLQGAIDKVRVDLNDFIEIANTRYKIDTNLIQ